MDKRPVKVLQIQIGGKTFSGVASYLYQYYRNMDHSRVHYDFLFCRENSMELVKDDPALTGSKFYVLNAKRGNSNDYGKITSGVRKVLQEEHYDAVVVNTSIVAVIYACLLGAKGFQDTKFIAHAHNTDLVLGKGSIRAKILPLVKCVDNILRQVIRKQAFRLFTCSNEATRLTFGEESVGMDKTVIIRNAIDTERFAFNAQIRNRIREEQNTAEDAVVYGNVGSFCKRKNQLFLIRVFQKVHEKQPNSELWLIGDGKDRPAIEALIKELELSDSVKLLGQRSDVNDVMQAMDCFVFSTLSEGLGIVAIEAQAAGLPTIISDGVPKDVMITELAQQLELAEGEDVWANAMLNIDVQKERRDTRQSIKDAGYEITEEINRMMELFESSLSGK